MNYIGNVLYKGTANIDIDKIIKRCVDINDMDTSLPSLIIGYDIAKKYIKNFNILKKWYPEQNIYWTFNKTERNYEYIEDKKSFFELCINTLCNDIHYYYINIIKFSFQGIKKIVNFIKNNNTKIVYIQKNRFIYMYDTTHNIVYGLSLDLCEYVNVNKEKVKNIIKDNKYNIIIENDDFLPIKMKNIVYIKPHYTPLFYYKLIFI